MISKVENLPDDVGILKEIVAEQYVLIAAQRTECSRLLNAYKNSEARVAILDGRIALLEDRLFAPKNEKLAALVARLEESGQQSLFDLLDEHPEPVELEPEKEEAIAIPAHSRKKSGRKPLPDSLPREEVIHDIPEEEKVCACGSQLTCIGKERSEQLHVERPQFKVIVNIRLKYACKQCEGTADENSPTVKIAPVPPQIIPKSFATAALLAHIVIAKFVDALPLYRQENQFSRLGIDLSRATMANWMIRVASRCQPLLTLLRDEIRSGPLINADETTLQVMNEPDRKNTTKSYAWIFRGGAEENPAVIFEYHPTRAGKVARDFLGNYKGYVQSDGFSGYNALEEIDGITLCGCWAHARRKFVDVVKADKASKKSGKMRSADIALRYIKKLYAIEKEAKGLTVKKRFQLRQEKAKPVLDDFGLWLRETYPKTPPKGALGKAIYYSLQQWQRLNVYLEDGRLRPDNNQAENAIRPFVVGRKNWLFSGSPKGAHASATLYSLVESAKLNNLDPYKYIRFILEKIPHTFDDDDFKELLPTRVSAKQIDEYLARIDL
jgi:transposase